MSKLQHNANQHGCVRGRKDDLTQPSLQDGVFGGGGGGMERGEIKAAVLDAYRESHRVAANNQSVVRRNVYFSRGPLRKPSLIVRY